MGLLRSATGNVGSFPLTRKSSLVTVGWFGSSLPGPTPLAGGLKPPWMATQLTAGLGEKLGGGAGDAPSAAPTQTNPAKTPTQPDIAFAAILDTGTSSSQRQHFAIGAQYQIVENVRFSSSGKS